MQKLENLFIFKDAHHQFQKSNENEKNVQVGRQLLRQTTDISRFTLNRCLTRNVLTTHPIHREELYFINEENHLYVCNLHRLRFGQDNAKVVQLVCRPAIIPFQVQQIKFNASGTLLLIQGSRNACVVEISRRARGQLDQFFSTQNSSTSSSSTSSSTSTSTESSPLEILCHVFHIGRAFFDSHGAVILKARWHVLSEFHLVFLVSDNRSCSLLFYNLEKDIESIEQQYVIPFRQGAPINLSKKLVDFVFATSYEQSVGATTTNLSDWRLFTCYALFADGQINAFCPIVPQGWTLVVHDQVRALYQHVVSTQDALNQQTTPTDEAHQLFTQGIHNQLKWLNLVLNTHVNDRSNTHVNDRSKKKRDATEPGMPIRFSTQVTQCLPKQPMGGSHRGLYEQNEKQSADTSLLLAPTTTGILNSTLSTNNISSSLNNLSSTDSFSSTSSSLNNLSSTNNNDNILSNQYCHDCPPLVSPFSLNKPPSMQLDQPAQKLLAQQQACSMLLLPFDGEMFSRDIESGLIGLALAHRTGIVEIFLSFESVQPWLWPAAVANQQHNQRIPLRGEFLCLERLDLSLPEDAVQAASMLPAPELSFGGDRKDCIYIQHVAGISRIKLGWIGALEKFIRDAASSSNPASFANIDLPPSKIEVIFNSRPFNSDSLMNTSLKGFTLIDNGSVCVVLSNAWQCHVSNMDEMYTPTPPAKIANSPIVAHENKTESGGGGGGDYQRAVESSRHSLSKIIDEGKWVPYEQVVRSLIAKRPARIATIRSSQSGVPMHDQYSFLAAQQPEINHRIDYIKQLNEENTQRVAWLMQESASNKQSRRLLKKKLRECAKKAQAQKEMITLLFEQQHNFHIRIQRVLSKIHQLSTCLSSAERKFCAELKASSLHYQQMEEELRLLGDRALLIIEKYAQVQKEKAKQQSTMVLSKKQQKMVLNLLQQEDQMIKVLSKEIRRLMREAFSTEQFQ